MKLYYIANSRLPTIKAYGLQIVKMCEAFTKADIQCELVIPKRHRYPNTGEGDILEYYNIKTPFKITELNSPDLIDIKLGSFLNKILFWIQQLMFALALKKYLAGKTGIVYSRDQFSLSALPPNRFKLFWEAHNFPKKINSVFYRKILDKIAGLIVISKGLKDDFAKHYRGSIVVAPDAVDISEFDIQISKEDARHRLNLLLDKKIAIYTGHLYAWKGVDYLISAAQYLNNKSTILIVGGTALDRERLNAKLTHEQKEKIKLVGFVPHKEVAYYLKAADCAILTGKKSETISAKYTSPLKMFEYMASGCPIVAQDLPSFREVLNDGNAFWAKPGDAKALADKIAWVFENEELAKEKAAKALEDVKKYTWDKRSRKIADFLQNSII